MRKPDEMTITEAADRKGVTRQTVFRAIREGRLPARVEPPPEGKRQSVWLVRGADLDAWQPVTDPAARAAIGQANRRARKGRAQ